MIVAFDGQTAAATHTPDMNPQNTYGAVLTLGVLQSAGAGSDTVLVEGSFDGTNFTVLSGTDLSDGSADNAPAATGNWRFDLTGIPHFQIRKTGSTDTFSAWYNYSIA